MNDPTARPGGGDTPTPAPPGEPVDLLDAPTLPRLGLSPSTLAAIFLGGALGSVARYLVEAHHHIAPGGFPWPTLMVNLSGSLAIGFILPLTEHSAARFPLARPAFVVGLLGGWTTYSTLAVEAVLLAKHGNGVSCVVYLAATVFGGCALVVLGHGAGRRFVSR